MAWRSFFAVQQQLFFWAINKTEVQKIDIKMEFEVSSWLWLDQRPYFCPNQDPEAVFLDFDLSKYQFLFLFRGIFQLSKLHLFVGNFKNNRLEIIPASKAQVYAGTKTLSCDWLEEVQMVENLLNVCTPVLQKELKWYLLKVS